MARERNIEGGAEANSQKTIILKVYIHCQECAKAIVNCLKGFQGVQEVNPNFKDHTVTIKGNKDIDPKILAERLQKKRNKVVEIISPTQKEKNTSHPKTTQPKVVRVILSIYIHCENCGNNIVQNIRKMAGVQSVEVNVKNLQVIVKGEFEPQKLLEHVDKRMGKRATIVKTETISGRGQQEEHQQQQQQQQQRQSGNENRRNRSSQTHEPFNSHSPPELDFVYAAEIFNDENSQACTIM